MNTILRTICLAFCLILSVSVITSCKKGTHPPATKPEAQGIGTGGQASTEMEGLAENDLLDNAGKDDFSLMGNQDDEYKKMYGRSTKPLLPIYFDFDQFTISAEQGERLQQNARYMLEHPEVKVVVEGNCDERGTSEYNLALGERRAQSAREYLVQIGVDPSRLRTESYGEERPLFPTSGEASWAENRRDDFVIEQ